MTEFNIELSRKDLFDNFKVSEQTIKIDKPFIKESLLHTLEHKINQLFYEKELFKVTAHISCEPYIKITRSEHNGMLDVWNKYNAKIMYVLNYHGVQLTENEIALDDFLL